MHFFFFSKKIMHEIESFICNNAAHGSRCHLTVIMQLMMFFCETLVIEFTWTFGDYFDMMIL